MPYYDYECRECEHLTETSHSMFDSPKITCEECGSTDTFKAVTGCNMNFKTSTTVEIERAIEKTKRRVGMRDDLRENYGVHEVAPVYGNTFEDAYRGVKENGNKVREKMSSETEINEKKTRQKQIERTKNFQKIKGKRIEAIKEKRKKEGFENRKIKTNIRGSNDG